jgi:sulfite reductase (NADPH) hemoprotein beta-component
LADVLGFCRPDQVVAVAEAIVTIQRDFGDRTDRKHARLKYTVEDHGLAWLHGELEKRLGYGLQDPRSFRFSHTGDEYGWRRTDDGMWHLVLHIENGRVADRGVIRHLAGLREIARVHDGEFRLSPNQNLIISGVTQSARVGIERLVTMYGLDTYRRSSSLRLNAMACVGFPTCALSMAESERYLPELVGKIDALMLDHGLKDQAITIRMTGCPNGCARPYLAEIGLVGKGPGLYNLHLGAAFNGTRLNQIYRESVHEKDILELLDQLFADYGGHRQEGEAFGDFLFRSGVMTAEPPAASTIGSA